MRPSIGDLLLLMSLVSLPIDSQALELRTAAQDSVPKYYLSAETGLMRGLCIDILKAIEELDPEIQIVGQNSFMPIGRIYHSLRSGSLDLFCGAAKTQAREQQVIYLSPQLYSLNHVLLANRNDPIQVNSFDDLELLGEDGVILTYLNAAAHHFLLQHDGLVLEEGTDLANLFNRLNLGRGRFIYYHDLGLNHYVRTHKLESRVRFLPTKFRSYSHYLAVSKLTSAEGITKLQNAVQTLSKTGVFERIYRRYKPL